MQKTKEAIHRSLIHRGLATTIHTIIHNTFLLNYYLYAVLLYLQGKTSKVVIYYQHYREFTELLSFPNLKNEKSKLKY